MKNWRHYYVEILLDQDVPKKLKTHLVAFRFNFISNVKYCIFWCSIWLVFDVLTTNFAIHDLAINIGFFFFLYFFRHILDVKEFNMKNEFGDYQNYLQLFDKDFSHYNLLESKFDEN